MKKFNLFKEIITANTTELKQAIESGKEFAININGEIRNEPFTSSDILIYNGVPDKLKPLEIILGTKYQVVVDDDRVLIKAFGNWQELIAINTPLATYDDTTADGVAEFSHKDLEDIGWHATEFNITYRELVEVLEEKANGTILCIEQEEPYQFSGFGFINDFNQARDILFTFCKTKIKKLIDEDDDFKRDSLTEDEEEAAEFFEVI
ncbi:MAG: hypothetical protein KAR81_05390 [Sulfurimonas sp.]|nr:hypothetical protein [Sulfurimonas sp.]